MVNKNIPILPEAFMTFASKSYWPLLLSQATIYDTIIMVNDSYFDSIVQCPGVLHNVQVYCAMSMIKIYPY